MNVNSGFPHNVGLLVNLVGSMSTSVEVNDASVNVTDIPVLVNGSVATLLIVIRVIVTGEDAAAADIL